MRAIRTFPAILLAALAATGSAQPPAKPGAPPTTATLPVPATSATQAPPQAIPDATQPLSGTLFFTREQRDRLDRARKRGEVVEENEATAPETPPVINGVLRRSDGKTTVWVDGKPYADRTPKLVQSVQPNDVGGEAKQNIKILGALEPAAAPGKKVTRVLKPKSLPSKPQASKTPGK